MLSQRILSDIDRVHTIVAHISNAMIRKSLLPYFEIRAQLLLRAIRKSAFDELHGLLQASQRRDDRMQMIRHDHELVQPIGGAAVMIDGVDQEIGPSLIAKKVAAPPRAGRDHVSLLRVSRMLPCRSQVRTSGAKAPIFFPLYGAPEGAPFQSKPPMLFQSPLPTLSRATKLTATADDWRLATDD